MKGSPNLKDLEKCVRCGSCKAYCPTYDEDKSEAMSARGRLMLLRSVLRNELAPTPALNDRIFSCLLCEACSNLCPSNVDIIESIYKGRNILRKSDKKRRLLRLLAKIFVKNPDLSFKTVQFFQKIITPYLSRKGMVPSNLRLPDAPFKDMPHMVYKVHKKKGRVAIFTGCSINYLYPHLGISLVNVLLKAGYEVIVPIGEVCCGVPFRALGLEHEATELANKNMRIFGKLKVEAVLSLCPTCILALKNQYPKIIGSGIPNAMDVSSFLIDKLELKQLSLLSQHPTTVTYHDPCHLLYGLGVRDEPRELLKKIGMAVIEKEESGCCGFGGVFSFSNSNKELSKKLLKNHSENFIKTGASAIVTSCPGCMMHLGKAVKQMPVFHMIEVIEETYCSS